MKSGARVRARAPRRWRIHLSLESKKLRVSEAYMRRLVAKVLRCVEEDVALAEVRELHVLLVNDARMREINFEFREKDKPTDVLSFPQFTPRQLRRGSRVSELTGPYLGDLVISTETTIRQAQQFEVSVREELLRLVVHGVLHLCGYDHEGVAASEAARMRRRERSIRELVSREG